MAKLKHDNISFSASLQLESQIQQTSEKPRSLEQAYKQRQETHHNQEMLRTIASLKLPELSPEVCSQMVHAIYLELLEDITIMNHSKPKELLLYRLTHGFSKYNLGMFFMDRKDENEIFNQYHEALLGPNQKILVKYLNNFLLPAKTALIQKISLMEELEG